MSDSTTPNPARTAPATDDRGLPARGWRWLQDAIGRGRVGTIALIAGGALLARALRGRGRGRRLLQATAGLALLGLGVRQRLTREGEFETGRPASRGDDTGETDSSSGGVDTASRTAHSVEPGTNPRDVTREPEVETETDPDEGSVRFTTDGDDEPRSEPHLDETDEGADDPRLEEGGDETEVDLSKTAMADEPNEAVGPQPEQAQPASTEETEPEPTPAEDASHVQADEPGTDAHDEGSEEADLGESEEGADAAEGEDVSTEDRYEGERGEDGTVGESDEGGDDDGESETAGDEDETADDED